MEPGIETKKFKFIWDLWYHDPENKKDYSEASYIKIADIRNSQQFWSVIDMISKEAWESGMFFFMRRGYRPLWDAQENEAGGAWSKKLNTIEAYTVFIDLMVHAVVGELLKEREDTLVGLSISPKGPSSIIKIWNNTTTVSKNHYLNNKIAKFEIGEDVTYTAHKSRPK